jgi:hypothetical protein
MKRKTAKITKPTKIITKKISVVINQPKIFLINSIISTQQLILAADQILQLGFFGSASELSPGQLGGHYG